jgi:hypothetical protein
MNPNKQNIVMQGWGSEDIEYTNVLHTTYFFPHKETCRLTLKMQAEKNNYFHI